mmetsp:Transcript_18541/g.41066  ORF Transcript_18541/g.41066 Transcript_18541/m.41066 type:complete len:237 (+) Transcript_18541:3551-4261(+)
MIRQNARIDSDRPEMATDPPIRLSKSTSSSLGVEHYTFRRIDGQWTILLQPCSVLDMQMLLPIQPEIQFSFHEVDSHRHNVPCHLLHSIAATGGKTLFIICIHVRTIVTLWGCSFRWLQLHVHSAPSSHSKLDLFAWVWDGDGFDQLHCIPILSNQERSLSLRAISDDLNILLCHRPSRLLVATGLSRALHTALSAFEQIIVLGDLGGGHHTNFECFVAVLEFQRPPQNSCGRGLR